MWGETLAMCCREFPEALSHRFDAAFTRIIDRTPAKWRESCPKNCPRVEQVGIIDNAI